MSNSKETPLWRKILWRGVIVPVLILSLLGVGQFSYTVIQAYREMALASPDYRPEDFDGARLYKRAFEYVRDLHVTLDTPEKVEAFTKEWEHKFDATGELKTEEGTDKAIRTMLSSLAQRFDAALDKQGTEQKNQRIESSLTGIGATLRLSGMAEIVKSLPKDAKPEEVKKAFAISPTNQLVIEEPIEGSPAEKAGLKPGDIIKEVCENGECRVLNGMQFEDAVAAIKGAPTTTVTLLIERAGESKDLSIPVVRRQVIVPDVKFRDLGNGVSYVKLNDFMSKYAVKEMYVALKRASSGKALVLDLRGNPGGAVPAVLNMSTMLLEDGPVMVTRSRSGNGIAESEFALNRKFIIETGPSSWGGGLSVSTSKRPPLVIPAEMPIVVLVDEGSASASEILAGALQHNHRALIVGKTTHGKGVGQTVVPLPYGRTINVTSFEFVPGRTPNDWVGVIPDQIVERGSDPKVDRQLDSAVEILKEKIDSGEKTRKMREDLRGKKQREFSEALSKRDSD